MNNKGQTLGISIVVSIVILIIGLMVINFLTPEIDRTRSELNCSDASNISDGTKLLCLAVDIVVIYWVIIIFSILVGGIAGRFVSGVAARLVQWKKY